MTIIIRPNWPAPHNVTAFTTTRLDQAGVPMQFYDDERHITMRDKELIDEFDLPEAPHWLTQVHGSTIITLPTALTLPAADAAITRTANSVCAVLTADCLPILITNTQGSEVVAIHGGWRSLAENIIEQTITQLTSQANDLLVWLGPAISQAMYEVGTEVFATFVKLNPKHAASFIPSQRQGHYYLDLYDIAKRELNRLGIAKIYGGNFCTYSDHRFYSYRRMSPSLMKRNMASLIYFRNP